VHACIRGERRKRRRREAKRKKIDLDKVEQELRAHYGWLLVTEAETEKKMYDKAMRMDRKRRKQTKGLVI